MLCCAADGDRIEHVTLHPAARPDPVVGLYLSTRGLFEAERQAAWLLERTLRRHRELLGWDLVRAEAPLMRPEALWGESLDR